MTDLSAKAEAADWELRAFHRRMSEAGRTSSYARFRRRGLRYRLPSMLFCLASTVVLVNTLWAIGLVALAIVADVAECAVLAARAKDLGGPSPPRAERLMLAALASLQAFAISGFALLLATAPGHDSNALVLAILIAGFIDAGYLSKLNSAATLPRLWILGAATAVLLVYWPLAEPGGPEPLFASMSLGFMLFIVALLFRENNRARARSTERRQAALTAARDLAQSEIAERRSREDMRRLVLIADKVSDAILTFGPDMRISWFNDAFPKLLGHDGSELKGKALDDLPLFAPVSHGGRLVSQALQTGQALRTEIEMRRHDGRAVWLDIGVTPMHDSDGAPDGAILLARDIGAAKARERALAEARRSAEEAMRAKGTFLATMSHEIRTPMNGVISAADLLLETSLDGEQQPLVETIASSGEALLAIVNDVLDLSSLEAGGLKVAERPFDLGACLRSTLDLVRPLAEAKGLTLAVQFPDPLPGVLLGDPGRLRQIVVNLLSNAIKFTTKGEVGLDLTTTPTGTGVSLSIAVRDTGIGIAADKVEHVFGSFAQADESISGRYGGTGLGLSISRGLAEAMGGQLRAQSLLGRGSVFTLDLVLALADSPETSAKVEAVHQLRQAKVLIADDNRTNILLLEKILARLDLDIVIATDGREAVDMTRTHCPDLILMDVQMPRLDGLDATREIRAWERDSKRQPIPIIALTANAFPEDRRRCALAGMTDFSSKPYRKADLLTLLQRYLGDHAPSQPAAQASPTG